MTSRSSLAHRLAKSDFFGGSGWYKGFIWVMTFLCYMSYHLSRKPVTVVTNVLHNSKCSNASGTQMDPNCTTSWAPFANDNYVSALDYVYLFAYAIGMFISGHVAERMNLRYFLTLGMMASGVLTCCFGLGFLFNIHVLAFYLIVQIATGLFQSTGWPAVVTVMGNWYGKKRRGLIMGIWNSHTSIGNILGGLLASIFLTPSWETRGYWFWSFASAGAVIFVLGIIVFFTVVPEPQAIGLPSPNIVPVPASTESGETDALLANDSGSEDSDTRLPTPQEAQAIQPQHTPISFFRALRVPGVLEFSFSLFFAKLVSYTFLYWLPFYINSSLPGTTPSTAGELATLFDVGGIPGAILAGYLGDVTGASALTCAGFVIFSTPMMFIYKTFGSQSLSMSIGLLMVTGAAVNGPYCLITTSVSADLGTHPSLRNSAKALATVTAIIDGTGSIGAALGPLIAYLCGKNFDAAFYILIAANITSLLLLSRLIMKDIRGIFRRHHEGKEC